MSKIVFSLAAGLFAIFAAAPAPAAHAPRHAGPGIAAQARPNDGFGWD